MLDLGSVKTYTPQSLVYEDFYIGFLLIVSLKKLFEWGLEEYTYSTFVDFVYLPVGGFHVKHPN